MSKNFEEKKLQKLLELGEQPWIEFKTNKIRDENIGEYISALSNSAALERKQAGFLIFGIDDQTKKIIGTNFISQNKIQKQEMGIWFSTHFPNIDIKKYDVRQEVDGETKCVLIFEIQAAFQRPTRFLGREYIRVGSSKTTLTGKYDIERKLWDTFRVIGFEKSIALEDVSIERVFELLDLDIFFDFSKITKPQDRMDKVRYFERLNIIEINDFGNCNITNLGAILFAKKLSEFNLLLENKAIRLVIYKDKHKKDVLKEIPGIKGYAVGFNGLMKEINNTLDIINNEENINKDGIREKVIAYSFRAIRELVVNALLHQDFTIKGSGPQIEIFKNRIEISNLGNLSIPIDRLIDYSSYSINNQMACLMRYMNICEERGSGIDTVVMETEELNLPPPSFEEYKEHKKIKVTLFAKCNFNQMTKKQKVDATFLHCVMLYLECDPSNYMTNGSLRNRFKIEARNSAIVSRLIKSAIEAKKIKIGNQNSGTKSRYYIPFWAEE